MKTTTHNNQRNIWEQEHQTPYLLPPMDSTQVSSGVTLFWRWLQQQGQVNPLTGIEMGCGKGRNSIWLAQNGMRMTAFDFACTAIHQAQQRATTANVTNNTHFIVHDATQPWPFHSDYFDFAIDCFASTDIDSPSGRSFARDELFRILKPKGLLLVYTLSTDDEFHKAMITQSPASEKNAFLHPTTGKFEKVFDYAELMTCYAAWNLIAKQRIHKTALFFGKEYRCKHFWLILQK